MRFRTVIAVAALGTAVMLGPAVPVLAEHYLAKSGKAKANIMRMTKVIPMNSTLEYRIQGQLVQSMNIAPGTYRITIEEIPTPDNQTGCCQ